MEVDLAEYMRQQKKKEETENETNTDGIGDSEAPEAEREPEPIITTGEAQDIDGTSEPEPEPSSEVLSEVEGNDTADLDSSRIKVFTDDSNGALGVELGSEDDISAAYEGLVKTLDLSWRYLKNNSLVSKFITKLGEQKALESDINATTLTHNPEYLDFNLEEAFKRDGIPLEDQELYAGIKTPGHYEYVKQVIEDTRADEEILSNGDEVTEILSFPGKVVDFVAAIPMFKGVDAALGGLWKAGNLADKVTRVANWKKFFSWLKPGYMEDLFKAAGTGTVFGTIDYASKHDASGEEAFYYGLTLSLIDGGFRSIGRVLSDKLKKKMADEIVQFVSAQDRKQLALSNSQKDWEEILKEGTEEVKPTNVNKLTKALATRGATATIPYQGIFSNNNRVREMAKGLFTLNDEFIENVKWLDADGKIIGNAPAEFDTRFMVQKHTSDYLKITDRLDKIYKDVKKYEGKSPREYLWDAYNTSGTVVPENLPHRSEIIDMAKLMRKKMEDLHNLEIEVRGQAPDLEESFLPFEETGANFSIEKIVARQKAGIKGSKPGYLPRSYSREAIEENQVEFKELLKQGLINTKAVELGDELTEEALRAYADSPELTKAVETQFEDILNALAGIRKKGRGTEDLRRTVRIDDRALYKFFEKDSLEGTFNYLRNKTGKLMFERSVKRLGYKDYSEFKKIVDEEYNAKKVGLIGKEREKVDFEQGKTIELIDQMEAVMMYPYLSLAEATSLFQTSPKAVQAIEGARNLLMSSALCKTVISSFADVMGMSIRYGLGSTFNALMRTVGGTFERAFREIAHLPKSEMEQILDCLVTGIDETMLHSSFKFSALHIDDAFYGAGNASKVPWTRALADKSFVLTGQRAFDSGLRKMAIRAILNDMLKNPARKAEITSMMKNKSFSEDVQKEILMKVDRIVNKPTLADVPKWAYKSWGRFFHIFQSWLFAHTSNFTYPLINGKYSSRFVAESVLAGTALTMLSVYTKEWLKGGKFDLDKKDDQERFLKAVFDQGLGDFIGAASIYWDWGRTVMRKKPGKMSEGLASLSPVLTFADEGIALFSNLFKTLVGLGRPASYYEARNALRFIPLNTAPFIERYGTVIAAEKWSGKSRNSKGKGKGLI